MHDKLRIAGTLALLLTANAAHAEWKGKGEAGIVLARGNTQTETINLKLGMSTTVDKWKHELGLAALRATNDGTKTADRYLATWQSDYNFSARAFWFGGLRYENDKFSGFRYSASVSGGAGYKFVDTEKVKLSGQIGIGYRRIETQATPSTAASTSNNAIATAGMSYENQLTATTKLVDKFTAESGEMNTLLTNFIGVEVKMTTALALAAGLDARYNTKPPAPLKKTDTLTTLNLVYSF
jgi:putative salt-induced outer membrane protein